MFIKTISFIMHRGLRVIVQRQSSEPIPDHLKVL